MQAPVQTLEGKPCSKECAALGEIKKKKVADEILGAICLVDNGRIYLGRRNLTQSIAKREVCMWWYVKRNDAGGKIKIIELKNYLYPYMWIH